MSNTSRPNAFLDACCWPARRYTDFDDQYESSLTNAEALAVLRYNIAGVITIIIINGFLFSLWLLTSLVPGFCRFDGAAGEASAISHIGWWAVIEFWVLLVGAMSVWFGLHYTRNGKIEKGISNVRNFLVFYIIMLALAIIANIVHLVFSAIEWSNCTSTLCISYKGFLIAFVFLLAILIVMEAWQIYRVLVYRRNIAIVLATDKGEFGMSEDNNNRKSAVVEDVESYLPNTPLLKEYAKPKIQHKLKKAV